MHLVGARNGEYCCTMRWMAALAVLALVGSLALGLQTPASAAPGDPVLHEQSDARFAFAGAWTSFGAATLSGGSHAFTNTPGASVTFAFIGTRLDLIGMRGPKYGIASVSVDGAAATGEDLYSADSQFQQTVYSTGDLPAGLHVVRVTCSGTKNAASADAYVSVDAVWVSGTLTGTPVEESDYRIVKRGSWITYGTPAASGGSHMFTNVAGNELAVAFTGTRFDLVSMTGPKFGVASISIDGGAPVDADFYSASTLNRQVVFSTGDLGYGAHVVRVICTGRRNPSATDAFVGLDTALVAGTVTQAVMRYEETDSRLGWNGQFAEGYSPAYSAGRHVYSGPSWGAMAVSFVGTRMDWVAVRGPQYGIASVTVDSGAPGNIDLYSPGIQTRQVVYSTGELPYGQHTVVVSWTGTKNAAATGTHISHDAFDIGGDIIQAPVPAPPLVTAPFNYPWARYIVVDKSDLRLYLVENGAIVVSYPVAVGKASTPTPNAVWRVGAKYYTDVNSVYGPRKMRLFRQSGSSFVFSAYNMHGTNVDSSIGTYASHGCIRMHNYDVLVFFDMVPLGTMVVTRD